MELPVPNWLWRSASRLAGLARRFKFALESNTVLVRASLVMFGAKCCPVQAND